MKFAIIAPAITTGSFTERINFNAFLLFMSLFCLFIYCPLAHWTWHPDGFLNKWGVLDFAGGAVVHISAGFASLAGAIYLGKRKYKHLNLTILVMFCLVLECYGLVGLDLTLDLL